MEATASRGTALEPPTAGTGRSHTPGQHHAAVKSKKQILTADAAVRAAIIAAIASAISLSWEFPTRRNAVLRVVVFVIIVFVATMLAELLATVIEVGITRALPSIAPE